ncbi:MAG: BatA and WFA domain-containing protein [Candidatus Hydrogenedentes bacterium]|nr:BatA and WFA domain-containing protein [Candidatus Hydrogenedentota bacterium]
MAFAQPIAFSLFALFIPIVLLYLLKQRRRHVQVSTLLFWDKILRDEHSVTSLTKLRKLLSLLLQLLIVSFIVLALARPTFSKDLLGARRLVILLDVSASMMTQETGGTRFELVRARAAEEIRSMSQGDSAMLTVVGPDVDIVVPFSDSRRSLLDALEKIHVTHGSAKWSGAFELVRKLAPDPRETHVYVISDGAFDPVAFEPPDRTQFAFVRIGEAMDNAGITAFQVRPLPGTPRDFEIFFEVTNACQQNRRIPFEVRVDDQLVDAAELTLPPNSSEVRSIRQVSSEGGRVELVLDSKDAFALDNRAFGVLPAVERIRVLLVTENNLFLESALGTDDGIALETMSPALYPGTPNPPPDVTVFDRWAPQTTPDGPAVFIASWPADYGLETVGELTDAIVTDWESGHAVTAHTNLKNLTIPKGMKVVPKEGFLPIVRSFGDPLVLVNPTAPAQSLAIAFDTTETDLPLRVAYPILIANAIRYLAEVTTDAEWQSPEIGSILTANAVEAYQQRQGHHASEPIARIVPPSGAEESKVFSERSLTPVMSAGVYSGETAGHEQFPLFAANVNSRRETHIAPASTLPVTSTKPIPEIARGLRLGVDPWLALATLALGVVCAEWWLFHRRIVE